MRCFIVAFFMAVVVGAGCRPVDPSAKGGADPAGADASEPGEDLALDESGVTTLRVHYPAGAHAVSVRGDATLLDWSHGTSMTAGADDTWEYAVTLPPSVAQVEWKPLLDDATWSIGPNYLAKRGQTVDVYPHFYDHQGTVKKLFDSFHSSTLNNDRAVWLYLPPSYAENTRATFPVLYMHDGQNLFDAGAPWGGWHVQDALDAGAEDGSIREVIVVGPENAGLAREWEYTPDYDNSEKDGGGGDAYLTFLTTELKPQVDTMLRTRPGRATTGVLGSSLGGLISAYAGVTKAATFGLVGAMSPSTWWNDRSIVADVAGMTSPRPDRVYVDYGDGDDGGEDTVFLVQKYLAIGYVEGTSFHSYIQPGGQHQENYWAQRFPGAAKFLLGPR